VENGEKWLTRAADWFDSVQQFDKDLKDFELPESVRKVSQPPKEERYRDEWTNIRLSQPKPGDFFNRRTCSWYINSKRKETVLLLGLIPFTNGDVEKARQFWDRLKILDQEFYEEQKQVGKENATTHARLIWNIENNKISLYATPDEMKVFDTPQLRLAVLLADLDMENESYKKAEFKYRHLLEIGDIKRRPDRASYIVYALGISQMMQFKIDESINTFKYFASGAFLSDTISSPRALNAYANYMTQSTSHSENFLKGVQCYAYIARKYQDTDIGNNAVFFLATCYDRSGERSKAKELYRYYLSKNPNGEYTKHAIKGLR
jgi:tetratricopeptide (TPR) repeat protein